MSFFLIEADIFGKCYSFFSLPLSSTLTAISKVLFGSTHIWSGYIIVKFIIDHILCMNWWHVLAHTLLVLFCRREARWYHGAAVHCGWIYRLSVCESVCVCVCVCARFSGAGPFLPVRLSLPPAALPKCTASRGLTGEAHRHDDAHSSLRGPASTRVHFLFSSSVFVLVLGTVEGEAGS